MSIRFLRILLTLNFIDIFVSHIKKKKKYQAFAKKRRGKGKQGKKFFWIYLEEIDFLKTVANLLTSKLLGLSVIIHLEWGALGIRMVNRRSFEEVRNS